MAKLLIPGITTALSRFFVAIVLSFLISLMFWSLTLIDINPTQPALALVQQQEEGLGQILSQSRHTVRDLTGSSWQVVLFKRVQNNTVTEVNLRLVGFPEAITFLHPQPLLLSTNGGSAFQADDLFAQQSPAPNVGQYDMKDILAKLSVSEAVTLTLPLTTQRQMLIPIPVLLEWQTLNQSFY